MVRFIPNTHLIASDLCLELWQQQLEPACLLAKYRMNHWTDLNEIDVKIQLTLINYTCRYYKVDWVHLLHITQLYH